VYVLLAMRCPSWDFLRLTDFLCPNWDCVRLLGGFRCPDWDFVRLTGDFLALAGTSGARTGTSAPTWRLLDAIRMRPSLDGLQRYECAPCWTAYGATSAPFDRRLTNIRTRRPSMDSLWRCERAPRWAVYGASAPLDGRLTERAGASGNR